MTCIRKIPAFLLYSCAISKSMKFSRSPNTSFSFEILNIKAQYFYCQIQGLLKFRIYETKNIAWEWNCLHISSSRPFAHATKRNETDNGNNLKSDQSMFSYSQTLEFYRMCVIVVGNVVQHEWPILMRVGAFFFCGGGNFCGVLGFFVCGFVFFQGTLL